MDEASFCTALTDVNDDKERRSACAQLLNRDGLEYKIDMIHQKMEEMQIPKLERGKSKVDNVVPIYTEIESMVTAQVACTWEQLDSRGLNACSRLPGRQLPWAYVKSRTGVCSVVCNVVDKGFFDLLLLERWKRFSKNKLRTI